MADTRGYGQDDWRCKKKKKMKIGELIDIETELLKFDKSTDKFNLSFSDLLKFNEYKEKIGKITDTFFRTQVDYANIIKDDNNYASKLQNYHDKLINSNIDIDVTDLNNILCKKNIENGA